MHKVRMLKDVLGSRNGIHVEKFEKGSEHEVSDGLLNDFVSMGAVEMVEVEMVEEEKEKDGEEAGEEVKEEEAKVEAPKSSKGKK